MANNEKGNIKIWCTQSGQPEGDPIIVNNQGGKQSKIEGKMTEVPPIALIEVSKVMGLGSERYPREADETPNWYKIGAYSNLDHALLHAANFLSMRNQAVRDEVVQMEELSHFAARAMMALEQFIRGNH